MALDEALERAVRAYDKERFHPSPSEVVAQNLGYKGINNGAALSAIASLRYFGLLERSSEGMLAVTKDVEAYKFAPDLAHKQAVVERCLKRPTLYAELLEKFSAGLPSDGTLRYELIQRGFAAQSADVVLAAFRRSVDFVGHRSNQRELGPPGPDAKLETEAGTTPLPAGPAELVGHRPPAQRASSSPIGDADEAVDRIPVRLPGGRRAWVLIPMPFYEADKLRLKAQIDLLLTQDEEEL